MTSEEHDELGMSVCVCVCVTHSIDHMLLTPQGDEITAMKNEIHRMEVRSSQLARQKEVLIQEMEKVREQAWSGFIWSDRVQYLS